MINEDSEPKLFAIIFGEGLVNDAVSIIMFTSVGLLIAPTNNDIDVSP